ncbi:hypothetical protein [Flavihumibacter sp. UBA7668]|uniref:hypothetical protein n=1 Tax=Flavihumibacter sp. UBA7668 TaxID=1946542 RepID=UPI0025C34A6D|nr:hypothetical protein [Flavihumibacter sp. UBA7668]
MKKIQVLLGSAVLFCFVSLNAQITEKDANKFFAPKGNHRSPFKGETEACLTSVNLQFKLASRETLEKRGAGNIISWAFLEGIDETLMQEIANEYYTRLALKLKENGISVTDEYREKDAYKKLVEKSSDRNREVFKKNWGVSRIITANEAPYIEYPVGMMGAHSSLGNDLKKPVGQVFITIDFAEFVLKISQSARDIQGLTTTKSKSTLIPRIRIEGVSQGAKMRGDGSYALFTGRNWGYTNAIMPNDKALHSELGYALETQAGKGMPETMKRFKSNVAGDMAAIFSGGLIGNGRATGEFTYTVKADPALYKKAVLDALDTFNNYLIAYIKANR